MKPFVGMRVRAVKNLSSDTSDFNDVPSKKYGWYRGVKIGEEFVISEVRGESWYAKDLGVWTDDVIGSHFAVVPNEDDLSGYEELFV